MEWEIKEFSKHEVFAFLDDLRDSGVTNMFGAGPFLVDEFGVSRKEARVMLSAWMQSFA